MDVKRKIWMRALSVFLATLMVIQILPLNAFAKDVVQKQAIEDTQPKVSDNDEITVKTEIESMRTENSKTFLTDDNGYYQITSAIPLINQIQVILKLIQYLISKHMLMSKLMLSYLHKVKKINRLKQLLQMVIHM